MGVEAFIGLGTRRPLQPLDHLAVLPCVCPAPTHIVPAVVLPVAPVFRYPHHQESCDPKEGFPDRITRFLQKFQSETPDAGPCMLAQAALKYFVSARPRCQAVHLL